MENIRIYEIPKCKMVSSKCAMFGEGKLEMFDEWFSKFERPISPKDFLWYDNEKNGFVWYYLYDKTMTVPKEFDLVDFDGGLYAVASGIDGNDSTPIINEIISFIDKSENLEIDSSRAYLGNVITPPAAFDLIEYNQMDYYVPIKAKK